MKKINKIILILLIILLILAGVLISIFSKKTIIGEVIKQQNSFTTAICNDANSCQDYEVKCEGNKILSITRIWGAEAQFSSDWNDPRNKTRIEDVCK